MKKNEQKWLDQLQNFLCENVLKKISVLIFMTICLLGGCTYLNQRAGLSDDNPIEEAIEKKIKNKINIDIDLTPSSPEG